MNAKSAQLFECKICDFKCSKQSNYDRHLLTGKHVFKQNLNNFEHISCQNSNLQCDTCGKSYKGRNGLWYHKQKCKTPVIKTDTHDTDDDVENIITDKKLILMLINQNKELMEFVKNGTNNTI